MVGECPPHRGVILSEARGAGEVEGPLAMEAVLRLRSPAGCSAQDDSVKGTAPFTVHGVIHPIQRKLQLGILPRGGVPVPLAMAEGGVRRGVIHRAAGGPARSASVNAGTSRRAHRARRSRSLTVLPRVPVMVPRHIAVPQRHVKGSASSLLKVA